MIDITSKDQNCHNRTLELKRKFLFKCSRWSNLEKVSVDKLGGGFYRVVARHGFMETPAMPKIMALMREQALDFDMENVSFFLGSERLQAGDADGLWRWQAALFRFPSRNALDAAVYFEIPIDQVIEVGIRLRV